MDKIRIKLIRTTSKAPVYSSQYSAGADIFADIDNGIKINPGETVFIPSGFSIEIPNGYAGLVYPRSGLSSKRGLAPANKVGVIDPDCRGEVIVALHNHSLEKQTVSPGDRIAQLLIAPVVTPDFEICEELSDTIRSDKGFGSTGY